MKKVIALIFAFAMMLTLAACNKEDEPPKDNDTSTPTDQEEDITESKDPLEWGITDRIGVETEDSIGVYAINFPHFTGASSGHALIANQNDGTIALISGQNMDSPKINTASELFPAYFEQLQYTLEKYYGLRSSNFELSLLDTGSTVIADHDMYTFTGVVSFDYNWQNEITRREYQFISYATTMKTNGGYAYWVVYDCSDEQSNGELIKEHALNMAKTFREER